MKFKNLICPECGQPALGTLEVLEGVALFTNPDTVGNVEYDGETKVFWDSQRTVCGEPEHLDLVCLLCPDGHDWYSEMLDSETVEVAGQGPGAASGGDA